jgi:predicted metalloprotease
VRWDESHDSRDVEDRRGQPPPPGGGGGGGGLGLILWLASRFGWPGLLIGAVAVAGIYGARSCDSSPSQQQMGSPTQRPAEENRLLHFVGYVLDDAQSYWEKHLDGYHHAKLVAYTGATQTRCGYGSAAVGPFYCPMDEKVYVDLSFYKTLRDRMGAPGDFAQAYVIAHEVGHHVQKLSGRLGEGRENSVSTELQADCFAGAWAADADRRDLLEVGDVDEAMNAATAVGDDTLQRRQTGYVRPETFTHGSAAQRRSAFTRGMKGGPRACTN